LFLVYNDANFLGEHVLYALTAALFLLPAVFGAGAGGWPRRLLAQRWLAWLGLVSYGIFLYHGPIVQELDQHLADEWIPGSGYLSMTAVALALTIACAAASYYLVERPTLRFKDRGSSSRKRDSASAASSPDASASTARQASALSGSASTASRAKSSA
jgi:peptidoglycan/LPS O-acetylase OafA/YrhL